MQRWWRQTSLPWGYLCTCPVSTVPGWALWAGPAFKDLPFLQGHWSGTYGMFVFAKEACSLCLWIVLAAIYLWKGSILRGLTFPLWKESRSRRNKTPPHPSVLLKSRGYWHLGDKGGFPLELTGGQAAALTRLVAVRPWTTGRTEKCSAAVGLGFRSSEHPLPGLEKILAK